MLHKLLKLSIACLISFSFLTLNVNGIENKENKTSKKQAKEKKAKKNLKGNEPAKLFYKMSVTATGMKKDSFDAPKPVSVISGKDINEKAPDNVSQLLLNLPGVDVNGVGANQSRPVIRGLRGQRILLMEDGIRMNNSRRQSDFGEIPALVNISDVERVEVVRGPASVLYGSDAIGGVINIIPFFPEYNNKENSFHGSFGYRYSSSDGQNRGMTNIYGNAGKLGFMLSGNIRKANDYTAPSGSFGDINLDSDTSVHRTGVKDGGLNFLLNYKLKENIDLTLKYDYYHAVDAGYGYVDPADYDPGAISIQILYPMQDVQKYSFKYQNKNMDFSLADQVTFKTYYRTNERELSMNIFVPFGIPGMPEAGVRIGSDNYTKINTAGFRLEMNKALNSQIFSYGIDYFKDSTNNTDSNLTQVEGFGPPHPMIDETPLVPNAGYSSLGVFVQDEISLLKNLDLTIGVRYQNVNAKTKTTTGLENEPLYNSTDSTFVGAANLSFAISDNFKLVLSVGRGFRSPNLIERFFNGPTPEGSGFQSRNTDLKAETSLNVDIGFKYRSKRFFIESSYYRNTVKDGIRVGPTGNLIYNLPEYRNINIDKLRVVGYEISGGYYFPFGITVLGNYSKLDSTDLGNMEQTYVDTYSSKFILNVRYENPKSHFWFAYNLRINGQQKDIQIGDNPIGDTIPGFTVHSISGGLNLFKKSSTPVTISLIVHNLTNELYSEFSNATFFRPAPKRYIVLNWGLSF